MSDNKQPSNLSENGHLSILNAQMERLVSAGNVAENLFQSPEVTKKVLFETRALWQIIINNWLTFFTHGSQVIDTAALMKKFRHLIAIEQSFQQAWSRGIKIINGGIWTRNSSREWIAEIIGNIDMVVGHVVDTLTMLEDSMKSLRANQPSGGWPWFIENQISGNGGGGGV
jgi:hypothetical protein